METKKTERANLEKKKIYFLEIGLITALALCFAAFEWSTVDKIDNAVLYQNYEIFPEHDLEPIPQIIPPKKKEPNIIPLEIVLTNDTATDVPDFPDPEEGKNPDRVQEPQEDTFIVPAEEIEIIPISIVPVKPIFPGGDPALLKFIAENTKYPERAKENGVSGKVFVSFVIGTDGKVEDVYAVNNVNEELNAEAIRVISMLPDWIPGRKGNKNVAVSYIIPINFVLK